MTIFPPSNLQDDLTFERSEVVANARMNRERNVSGNNSYAKDLGLDPLKFLMELLQTQPFVRWLDLCCGTGRALLQSAVYFENAGLSARVSLLGIDLIAMFESLPSSLPSLRLEQASVSTWSPDSAFDLITCVHGLHYVGDKLGFLTKAVSWLTDRGVFITHLDYANLRLADGRVAAMIGKDLKRAGFDYRPTKRLAICEGRRTITLPYRYLGADDQAGPNYTGQPAVNSYYESI